MTDAILSTFPHLAPVLAEGRRFYEALRYNGVRPVELDIECWDSSDTFTLVVREESLEVNWITRVAPANQIAFSDRRATLTDDGTLQRLRNALSALDHSVARISSFVFLPSLDIVGYMPRGGDHVALVTRASGVGSFLVIENAQDLLPAFRRLGAALAPGERRTVYLNAQSLAKASAHERLAMLTAMDDLGVARERLVDICHGASLALQRDGDLVLLTSLFDGGRDEREILAGIDLREPAP